MPMRASATPPAWNRLRRSRSTTLANNTVAAGYSEDRTATRVNNPSRAAYRNRRVGDDVEQARTQDQPVRFRSD